MFTHLKAAEAWLKAAGGLPVNVKFLIEGEEEVGGANLESFVAENRERLACDYAVISDTSQFAPGMPAITYGLKGLAYFEVIVQGANRDLHSGTFGGAVAEPVQRPGDDPGEPEGPRRPDPDRRLLRRGPAPGGLGARRVRQAAVLRGRVPGRASASGSLEGEAGYTTLERKWARPTCDVNGLYGGYQGPGPKTVLPCKAGAKLSFRLVPDQDPRTDRRARSAPTSGGLPAGRDLRGHRPPRRAGRAGRRRDPGRPRRRPRHRGGLRHQAPSSSARGARSRSSACSRSNSASIPSCSAGARTTTTSTAPTRSSPWPTSTAASRPAPPAAGAGAQEARRASETCSRIATFDRSDPATTQRRIPSPRRRLLHARPEIRPGQHRGGQAELPQPQRPGRRARGPRPGRRAGGRAEGAAPGRRGDPPPAERGRPGHRQGERPRPARRAGRRGEAAQGRGRRQRGRLRQIDDEIKQRLGGSPT